MKTLVIVESPAKGKTIRSILGAGYIVESSVGHIRDLPANKKEIPSKYAAEAWARLGIDVENGFKPLYVVPEKKRAVVAKLRKLAKEADRIILATDDDREGEAIAWHIARALSLKGKPERITFHEITKDAILKAFQQTRDLDYALVGAQEARRALDRLCGYGVSPALWNSIAPHLSAGRVQSAALAALARREHARMAHVPAEYHRITALVQPSEGEPFQAVVVSVKGQPLAGPKDFDASGQLRPDSPSLLISPEQAAQIVDFLKARPLTVKAVDTSPYSTRPPAPFTTSTLQQAASRALKLSPKRTMDVAQKLYETGFITYMRTDSPTLSEEATAAARDAATAAFGPDAVPPAARSYAAKSKNAQEAHEAIRPTGKTFRAPERTGLAGEELALYDLVYRRTVASQMTDLQGSKTVLTLGAGAVALQASGRVVLEPGFTRIYLDASTTPEDQALPNVQEQQQLPVADAKAEVKKTPAPPRYSEASLVQALEREGIGRPSTYASILGTLDTRGYTRVEKGQLHVTWLGLVVAAYLAGQFPDLVDVKFTVRMEADLDRIASGELGREAYLHTFWTEGLAQTIQRAAHTPPQVALPRVPGAYVTARAESVVLVMEGRAAALPAEIVPDALTPELAAQVMRGETVTRTIRTTGNIGKKGISRQSSRKRTGTQKAARTRVKSA